MKSKRGKKTMQAPQTITINLDQPESPIRAFLAMFEPAFEDATPNKHIGFGDKQKLDHTR